MNECRTTAALLTAERWKQRPLRSAFPPTLGMELELQIVDRDTKALVDGARRLLRACADDDLNGVDAEFMQSLIEIKTGVCRDVAQAEAELRSILGRLYGLAGRLGYGLASSGTHPFSRAESSQVFPDDRYRRLANKMGAFAGHGLICGLHVHLGIEGGDTAIGVMNLLIPHLPHLIALSANSPFWRGADTRMASSRAVLSGHYPSAGLPPALSDWAEFLSFERHMRDSGTIASLKDLYWDIRPRPDLGTVEIRVCDAPPSLEVALGLAAFIRCLGVWAMRSLEENRALGRHFRPRHWIATENRRLAARHGLDADYVGLNGRRKPVRLALTELMEQIMPIASETGDERFLGALMPLSNFECGSQRQRRIYRATENMSAVVKDLTDQLLGRLPVTTEKPIQLVDAKEKEKFMSPHLMITDIDRRRLGTLIDRPICPDALERHYLSDLEQELERATTVDATEIPPDVVTMNSTVEISDIDTGDTSTYTLVYPNDADIQKNHISILAPVGTAILGYRVGDVIRWPAPGGPVRIRIESVLYQPERVGDFWR